MSKKIATWFPQKQEKALLGDDYRKRCIIYQKGSAYATDTYVDGRKT